MISTEELQSLVGCLSTTLSPLESDALRLYLEGSSYEQMAEDLGCDTKTIDNALQRVKRKILTHQEGPPGPAVASRVPCPALRRSSSAGQSNAL